MNEKADVELLGSIRSALSKNVQVRSSDQIHIVVEDGVVQLWGEVDSVAEKLNAESVARSIPGIVGVDNALTVAINQPAMDERKELSRAIDQALEATQLWEIGVSSVDRGIVRLAGHAHSVSEESTAIRAVSGVPGVRQVISDVIIGDAPAGEAIELLDDAALRSLVGKALFQRGITIYENATTVRRSIAYLRGTVVDPREIQLAEEVASGVGGIQDVVNELAVDHTVNSPAAEEALSARVTRALQRDGRVSPSQVHVQCVSHDAHLFGYVDSIDQQNAAIEVARRVRGVSRVLNNIVITDRTSLGQMEREQGTGEGGK